MDIVYDSAAQIATLKIMFAAKAIYQIASVRGPLISYRNVASRNGISGEILETNTARTSCHNRRISVCRSSADIAGFILQRVVSLLFILKDSSITERGDDFARRCPLDVAREIVRAIPATSKKRVLTGRIGNSVVGGVNRIGSSNTIERKIAVLNLWIPQISHPASEFSEKLGIQSPERIFISDGLSICNRGLWRCPSRHDSRSGNKPTR